DYVDFDQSLSPLSDRQLERLSTCLADNFKPFVIGETVIVSDAGRSAQGEFIVVPRTARMLKELPYQDAMSEVRIAVEIAQERGAKIVGLGAYTSVVTRGGLALKGLGLPALTTGNSYTVAASRQAIELAMRRNDKRLATSSVAVVGATGSIGRATS